MRMLLCTNGSPPTARALDVGARLAARVASAVDILAVPTRGQEQECRRQAEAVAARLEAAGLRVALYYPTGSFARAIMQQAAAVPYDLVVTASPRRRGLLARLLKPASLGVVEQVPASVLLVNGPAAEFQRLLVCTSIGPTSEQPVQFAADLAQRLGAAITVFHVMSQVPVSEHAPIMDLEATADELVRNGTREGAHLSSMLALLKARGITARAVVRHGLVLDEILAETRQGGYDLLIIGSHITPGIRSFLVENLSADIALAAPCPVLIVHPHEETPCTCLS
ncbi:MAG: universal stress protein [Chloroflexi bacterium]|nr:universal stress protein [Chloroflexota bacterium]MBU1747243.1 universal stress protein [Chloroflexota bacterium]MBU1879257.1 universal stress protein [Chloroflexota bacterium]